MGSSEAIGIDLEMGNRLVEGGVRLKSWDGKAGGGLIWGRGANEARYERVSLEEGFARSTDNMKSYHCVSQKIKALDVT